LRGSDADRDLLAFEIVREQTARSREAAAVAAGHVSP
jgi:hypothetical protein